jgi:hypothetical protein
MEEVSPPPVKIATPDLQCKKIVEKNQRTTWLTPNQLPRNMKPIVQYGTAFARAVSWRGAELDGGYREVSVNRCGSLRASVFSL